MVARVAAVGQDVRGLREGDRVVAWSPHQQYVSTPPGQLFPIPAGVSDEDAAFAILATTAQLGVRRAQLVLGERVGVIGLGVIGQLVDQYLAAAGCPQIIGIDRNASRTRIARAHGATTVMALDVAKVRAGVELVTGGRLLDVVFDVTGNPAVLAAATPLLRPLGRLVLLGDSPTPSQQHLGPNIVSNSLSILGIHSLARPLQGSHFYPWGAREMVGLFFDYLMQGKVRVADLITHRFSPAEAPQAYELLARDHSATMGVVFDWSLLLRPA
jgi:threonine dehydrogenase-like Zn-dependent dehydrogenase